MTDETSESNGRSLHSDVLYLSDESGPLDTSELELAIFWSLTLGVDKLSSKAQTIESLRA